MESSVSICSEMNQRTGCARTTMGIPEVFTLARLSPEPADQMTSGLPGAPGRLVRPSGKNRDEHLDIRFFRGYFLIVTLTCQLKFHVANQLAH
jgi:hypothetical protein